MPQVVIDYDKLSELLEDFYRLTNMRITFWDSVGQRLLLGCSHSCSEFCQSLQRIPEILVECRQREDNAMQVASMHQDRLHCFHCHAGMNEFIYPVVFDHALLGYFMFGQVRIMDLPDDREARFQLYNQHLLDKDTMEKKYDAFPQVTLALMESAGRMLGALASYAHLNGLMKMKNITLSDRIREYIKANFKEPIAVDSACAEFHISRSTLSHAVKDELNSTFVDILNSYRIKHVQSCLDNGESIADAAYMSGFNSENYMARLFKRSIGVSPSEYRQSADKKQAAVR